MTDWIEWNGGECPIKSPYTKGQVRFNAGCDSQVFPLRLWNWRRDTNVWRNEIIAYRITENHEPQEAPMTRDELIAKRAALANKLKSLDKQIAAQPKTIRVYVECEDGPMGGAWPSMRRGATHCRDFPLVDGVPEGFVPVEGE